MNLQTEKTRLNTKMDKIAAKLEKAKVKAAVATEIANKANEVVATLKQSRDYLAAQLELIEEHTNEGKAA